MKQLIVSLGLEKICMMIVENKGKTVKVYNTKSVDSSRVLRDDGMYSYTDLAKVLNDSYGKSIRSMEVWLVLPDIATNTEYVDTQKVQGMKVSELPDMVNSKLKDKHVCIIGENASYDISQIIYFSKKNIKTMTNELYGKKIPLTKAISNFTAVHNAGYFLGEVRGGSYTSLNSSAKVMMIFGVHRISYIVLVNDLPVHVRESDHNLMKTYSMLKETYNTLTFGDMLRVIQKYSTKDIDDVDSHSYENTAIAEEFVEVEENQSLDENGDIPLTDFEQLEPSTIHVISEETVADSTVENKEVERAVAREIKEMAGAIASEMSSVNDMVSSKYNTDNIEFIVVEKAAQDYLKREFGAFRVTEIGELPDTIDLGSATLDMRALHNRPREMMTCIGAVLESLKKGADFYE